ncbi:MAG: MafB family polymorphic toxin [Neisseriaceae bacterium]|nr:MafB family polymorphic toxin [Neisseriaceae bacterium]
MIKTIKKYLSGSLKNLRLLMILCLFAHTAYAQNDIAKSENYLPNGKYRLFGSGRGEVQNINNHIRLHGQLTQQAGNLSIETRLYQGDLSYQQHFHHHGHSVHAPFENKAQRNFSAKTGSVVQGGATLTDLSVTGYEIHPADAYDGEQGGGYPVPTGARDEYLYEVNGKEVSVKVVALDKLPPKANDNQLLQAVGIDPTAYNQPQTQDNHTQIERISFANAANSNAYGDFVDLMHNGQGWESVANPMPMTSWSLPVPERGAAYYSHPSITFVRIVPQMRATLGKPTPYDHDPNAPMVSHVSAPIPKYNPYDYPTSLPLFDNPLHKGKGSSSAGNSGDDSHQNNDNNPPVLGYYYGDDDELYFYSNSPYFEPVNNGNDDDYLLGLFVPNDENNYTPAYPISFPVVPNYPNYGNNQADEHYWWSYFVPGYGDYLSFKEAETGWDYTLATAGIVWKPARGAKVVSKVNKAKKAATNGLSNTTSSKIDNILNHISTHNGSPPSGYKGGKTFQNADNKLPNNTTYREYDINPYVKGQNRGSERIVVGNNGSVYYTNDHYGSFTKIK